ncbi:hypothetical protein L195_g036472, partial [Trifolium pratense]
MKQLMDDGGDMAEMSSSLELNEAPLGWKKKEKPPSNQ